MRRMPDGARRKGLVAGLAGVAVLLAIALLRPADTSVAEPAPKPAPRTSPSDRASQVERPRSWLGLGRPDRTERPAPPLAVEQELTRLLGIRYAACDLPAGADLVRHNRMFGQRPRDGAVGVQGTRAWRVHTATGEAFVQDPTGALLGMVRWVDAEPGALGACVYAPGVATVAGFSPPGGLIWICGLKGFADADGRFAVVVPAPQECTAMSASGPRQRIEIPPQGLAGLDLRSPRRAVAERERAAPSPWGTARIAWSRYRGYADQAAVETFVPQHSGDALTDDADALAWTYHYGAISPESRAWLATVMDPSAPPPPDPRTELPTSRERQIRAVWNTAEYLGAPVSHW